MKEENKVFRLIDIRQLNKQVALGEISATRMVEILNEMAYEHYVNKMRNVVNESLNQLD